MEPLQPHQALDFLRKRLEVKRHEYDELVEYMSDLEDEITSHEEVLNSLESELGLYQPVQEGVNKQTKTDRIMELIERSGETGLLPSEVTYMMRREGIELHENYASAVMSKAYKQGKLGRTPESRYFKKKPKPQGALAERTNAA